MHRDLSTLEQFFCVDLYWRETDPKSICVLLIRSIILCSNLRACLLSIFFQLSSIQKSLCVIRQAKNIWASKVCFKSFVT